MVNCYEQPISNADLKASRMNSLKKQAMLNSGGRDEILEQLI
jgi:hypothetical protein